MPVITFENVSKKYRLGAPLGNLRDAIPRLLDQIRGRVTGQRSDSKHLWALKDVTFQVEQGEAIGIVGPNGAGKSTILKLLSGITEPTGGRIQVNGKLAALIEVGAGFHPDLTGRENIYLYGSIMGLKRKDIDKLFDSIVEFAELKDFIDTPIKRYSSGMHVRLGFAVIAHLDPDVLLIDEVLAVGDMAFRKKCQERMHAFREMGKSIAFVSHNIYAVQALCDRTIYLKKGRIRAIGETKEVIALYINETNEAMLKQSKAKGGEPFERWGTGEVRITGVEIMDKNGKPAQTFKTGDQMRLLMNYRALKRVTEPDFRFVISAPGGIDVACASSASNGYVPNYIEGEGKIECIFNAILFLPNTYSVLANICSLDTRTDYDHWSDAVKFTVMEKKGGNQRREIPVGSATLVNVPYRMVIH